MTMTDATSAVRTYAVGDTAPTSLRGASGGACGGSVSHGYYCSLPAGHEGPQHIAIGSDTGNVYGVADVPDPIVEQPTPEVVAERLAIAERELQRLRTLRDSLTAERDTLQAEHDEFRDTVRNTAIRLAKQHDWCSVVDAALIEMGLAPMRQEYEVEVKVTATRVITVRSGTVDAADPNQGDIKDALGWGRVDSAFREQESDSGWETTDYDVIEWTVVDD